MLPLASASVHTRLSGQSKPRVASTWQGWPTVVTAAQVPQVISVCQQTPVAHCQSLLQEPPTGAVPPWGRQAGTDLPWTKSAQLIAAHPSPHCWTSAAVRPVCGAATASSHDASKYETQSARLVNPLSPKDPGSQVCARSQNFVIASWQSFSAPPPEPPVPPKPPVPPPSILVPPELPHPPSNAPATPTTPQTATPVHF